MHELAIADAVVSMVLERSGGQRVTRVGMRIGRMRQVVPSSLRFGFSLVTRDTPAADAQLEIVDEPVVVRCSQCETESRPRAFPLTCARCGEVNVVVTRGEELLVEWIETDGREAHG